MTDEVYFGIAKSGAVFEERAWGTVLSLSACCKLPQLLKWFTKFNNVERFSRNIHYVFVSLIISRSYIYSSLVKIAFT